MSKSVFLQNKEEEKHQKCFSKKNNKKTTFPLPILTLKSGFIFKLTFLQNKEEEKHQKRFSKKNKKNHLTFSYSYLNVQIRLRTKSGIPIKKI